MGSSQENIENSIVSIGNQHMYSCGTATNDKLNVTNDVGYYNVMCSAAIKGRYVKVQLMKNDAFFSCKEIEVYGAFVL